MPACSVWTGTSCFALQDKQKPYNHGYCSTAPKLSRYTLSSTTLPGAQSTIMQSRGLVSALEAGSTSQYQYVTDHVDILSTYDALQGTELLLSRPSCDLIDTTRHYSLSLNGFFFLWWFLLLLASTRSNSTNPELMLVLNIHFLHCILACPRICSGKENQSENEVIVHFLSLSPAAY